MASSGSPPSAGLGAVLKAEAGPARRSTIARSFVDTNVLVYAVDDDEPVRRDRARAVLRDMGDASLVISSQVLGELYVVTTRKLRRPLAEDAAVALVGELRRLPVVPIDEVLVGAAIEGARSWGISYWDALIVRAAEAAGCETILSEDLGHGRRYGEVQVEDPFR